MEINKFLKSKKKLALVFFPEYVGFLMEFMKNMENCLEGCGRRWKRVIVCENLINSVKYKRNKNTLNI